MATNNETIKLIIRTANSKSEDFDLELSSLSTIYDLKQQITLNHPTKAIPKDQRLIFSGKLLDDTSLLNQIFIKSSSGSSFMIHLVLDSDKTATTPKVPQSKTTTTTTVPLTPTVTEVPVPQERPISSTHSASYDQYLDELNKYQQQLQQYLINPNGCLPVSNYNTQAYLEYCYTHYQMYQNLHAYQRTVVTPPTIVTNTMQQPASTTTTTAPPPAAAAAAAAPQPAAAGNNNNELEPENDLLGILNMLVELFVLCSIIYFYSTFSRFLVVFVIFALLYLHCRGYLSIQRRRRVQVQPIPVVPEQPAENNAEHVGEDEAEGEQAGNEAQNQNDIQRPRTPSPPTPIVENQITTARLLFTAVSTFFSSLIPERPQRA